MTKLGVNIDHAATIRQARGTDYPNLVALARQAMDAGADGITIHLREDRRHIQDADLFELRREVAAPLNLEMALAADVIAAALEAAPGQVTLVPERREELTTEGGLDVVAQEDRIGEAIGRLRDGGIGLMSLFIEPDPRQVDAAVRVGAGAVEIHTGAYADAASDSATENSRVLIRQAADYAARAGLRVFAGHGLHYTNVTPIVAIRQIEELNIGHSIIARALSVGLTEAVAQMKALC